MKSVFSSSWWLDSTAGPGNWGLSEVKSGNVVVASMPWTLTTNRLGFTVISQPPLTQYLGPWISPNPQGLKYAKKLSREKELLTSLINQLPKYDAFSQSFAPEFGNWLPFYWRGFEQTTRYTYRLNNLCDLELVWSGFQDKVRTDIRKATKLGVSVERSSDIEAFLDVNEMTFRRQGIKPSYSRSFVRRLFLACQANDAGTIFLARGKDGRVHAGNLLVWNENCAYYLIGGGDPELRNSGATSLAMWHSIQFAATVSRVFDFEGSMIEPVERFFRGFGAVQTPYFAISHIGSRRLSTVMALRSIARSWF